METVSVLIVGGGPAGSACGHKLVQSGRDVVILDRARFPRHKVCAGWITPPIIEELQLDLTDYQATRVLQPITRFVTGLIGGFEHETAYSETVSYGIRRCEFDDYLLHQSGARLALGEPLKSLRRDGTDWIVNEQFRTPLVIGAAGHFCPVARQFRPADGPDVDTRPVVMAQEVEFLMTAEQIARCSIQPDRPELFFCPDLKGYGWVFRKGDWLNVGLGREAEEHLSAQTAAFVDWLRTRGKIEFELPARFQGHAYRLRTRLPDPLTEPGILLVGDALGLADRQSGEGIRPAIESGLLCATSIVASGSDPRQIAATYHRRLTETFGAGSPPGPRSGFTRTLREFAARQLMRSRWFTRRVLLDRWFLHRDAPRVVA